MHCWSVLLWLFFLQFQAILTSYAITFMFYVEYLHNGLTFIFQVKTQISKLTHSAFTCCKPVHPLGTDQNLSHLFTPPSHHLFLRRPVSLTPSTSITVQHLIQSLLLSYQKRFMLHLFGGKAQWLASLLHERSYPMSGPVSTGMGNRLFGRVYHHGT